MTPTKSFDELVQRRVADDPAFGAALLRQGVESMLAGGAVARVGEALQPGLGFGVEFQVGVGRSGHGGFAAAGNIAATGFEVFVGGGVFWAREPKAVGCYTAGDTDAVGGRSPPLRSSAFRPPWTIDQLR